MNPLKKLVKHTLFYGLATVFPRMLGFFLLPLYTSVMSTKEYGEFTIIYVWIAIFNIFLAYGMETAFFRFYNGKDDRKVVVSTSLLSILGTSLSFLTIAFLTRDTIAGLTEIEPRYISYAIIILTLDALVIVPFAWLRANEKPMRYAVIKSLNVGVNFVLNFFFLKILPIICRENPDSFLKSLYVSDFQISYILISNVIASGITLLLLLKLYRRRPLKFDVELCKRMLKYAMPIMIAGIAFTINEVLDKILLERILPDEIAVSEVGKYGACIKLAVFMTLFATAFRMGIEPFFFSHFNTQNPQRAYAQITNYFVMLGSIILLSVIVYADLLKEVFIRNPDYWEAMSVVPIIILASFFLGIYHNLSVWYKVTDRTHFGAYISSIGAILTIIINIAFIPKYGYMASAVATLVAYGSMMVLSLFFGRIYYPVPYNFRKITFYLGISILFSGLSFYVFNRNMYVGTVLLLLFLGLIYRLEGDMLKQIFLNKPSPKKT